MSLNCVSALARGGNKYVAPSAVSSVCLISRRLIKQPSRICNLNKHEQQQKQEEEKAEQQHWLLRQIN